MANNFGVYISSDTEGSDYVELGKGLPRAHVQSMRFSPADPNLMVVSNYGRGVYAYRFAPTAPPVVEQLPNTLGAAGPVAAVVVGLALAAGLAASLTARRRRRLQLPA